MPKALIVRIWREMFGRDEVAFVIEGPWMKGVMRDVSGLGSADLALRTQLEYQDRSAHGEQKNCSNCAFYKAGDKNQCGLCTLVRGPIHPLGYCTSWAAKG